MCVNFWEERSLCLAQQHYQHCVNCRECWRSLRTSLHDQVQGNVCSRHGGSQETTNITWLRVATALDPRFKDLKCLSKSDRAEVWGTIRTLLQEMERPAQPDNQVTTEPPTKKPALMLAHEDSIEQCQERYKVQPLTVPRNDGPHMKGHTGKSAALHAST